MRVSYQSSNTLRFQPVLSCSFISHPQSQSSDCACLSKRGWGILACSSPLFWKQGRHSKAVLHRIAFIYETWLWVSSHLSAACSIAPWAEQSHLRQEHVLLSSCWWRGLLQKLVSFCDPVPSPNYSLLAFPNIYMTVKLYSFKKLAQARSKKSPKHSTAHICVWEARIEGYGSCQP